MKAMIAMILLGVSFLTASAFARPGGGGGGGYSGGGGYGGNSALSCTYTDRGWEEHFGGHRTCQECKAKHDRCNETCTLEYTTCEARGEDYKGVSITLKGSGRDRYEAEANALRYCQRNFSNCSISSCSSSNEQVSNRECQ